MESGLGSLMENEKNNLLVNITMEELKELN